MTQSGLSRVVNFIQISIVHERTLSQIEPSAQSGRAFTSRVSVTLAPKHIGRKETSCSCLKSSKENR
jgi:hypothetical protein